VYSSFPAAGYVTNKDLFVCPDAQPYRWVQSDNNNRWFTYGGMLLDTPGELKWVYYTSNWQLRSAAKVSSPATLPLVADTVWLSTNANRFGRQIYLFSGRSFHDSGGPVGAQTRHSNAANVLFFDCHAQACSPEALKACGITVYINSKLIQQN
jgi:prepilin-type processing-associated H-X9-DG protein